MGVTVFLIAQSLSIVYIRGVFVLQVTEQGVCCEWVSIRRCGYRRRAESKYTKIRLNVS
jgi:hypothetical protein